MNDDLPIIPPRFHPRSADYIVHPDGRIWSVRKGRFMATHANHYPYLALRIDGRRIMTPIGTVVLETFAGPRPEGMQCRHLDDNPMNNNLSNLAWGTRSENMRDMVRNGHSCKGEKHGIAKLTEADVREIREAIGTHTEIARRFNVSRRTIGNIRNGKLWTHVR